MDVGRNERWTRWMQKQTLWKEKLKIWKEEGLERVNGGRKDNGFEPELVLNSNLKVQYGGM